MQRRPDKSNKGVSGSMQRSGDEGAHVRACERGPTYRTITFLLFLSAILALLLAFEKLLSCIFLL